MAKKKLLLLGAGPTSSLIAYNISKCQPLQAAFDIHCWEKSTRVGGRFSTTKCSTCPNSYADLGAQYLTWGGNAFSKPYFKNLEQHKLVKEFETKNIPGFRHDPTKTNYVCSFGSESIVEHFFSQGESSVSMSFNKRATKVQPITNSGDGGIGAIEVSTDKESEAFDVVVSTIPVPQLLQLQNMNSLLQDNSAMKGELEKVHYSTRFALGLFYDSKEGPFAQSSHVHALNFVTDDPIIRYWSVENKKRGNSELDEQCSIVVHTSVSFGAQNVEKTPDSMKDLLMEKVKESISCTTQSKPIFVKCHKWRYSQVERAFSGTPGSVQLNENFIAAGDGFSRSGLEGCIESSLKVVEVLKKLAA